MNQLLLFSLILTTGSIMAKPRDIKRPAAQPAELTQQVASYVTYPAVLGERNREGIVVVTFSVSEEQRVAKLQVHSANQQLNDDITRQLVGKKIRLADPNPFETYTVRLRFVR
ncbi:hypothetical protein [Rudanella lutea]|uniref:hypothetical protein n=1 Tax=Rudanella lutea TaxID=451374 RepID=UPI00036EA24D|nr:hypothetical protein [Rudanella lutea]